MRRLVAAMIAATTLTLAVTLGAPAFAADADPSMHQVYEAAKAGHLDQAQTMMDQVLKDHPQSARAHFVQAELYAKEGKLGLARSELSEAEQLKPGLPDEKPQAVQQLKAQLGEGGAVRSQSAMRPIGMESAPGARPFPWGMVLILVAAVALLWMLFRRRPVQGAYPMGATAGGAPGGYGGPGGGYGPGPMGGGGGIGSSIGGGLASGLAVGAGVVAGEEIAHHFLDGRPEGAAAPAAENSSWEDNTNVNNDMGGNDFGSNDSSGGWDDGGSSGGGGGDDWS